MSSIHVDINHIKYHHILHEKIHFKRPSIVVLDEI